MNETGLTREEAEALLWERGDLYWKLHSVQEKIYYTIKNSPDSIITIACSRRIGKTFLMMIIASEMCIKNPNTIIKFVSPEQAQGKKNIKDLMRQIYEDCPHHLKPAFKTQENIWIFPNGSEIQIAGTDKGNHESLRGGKAHLCIVDEAGFCDQLTYVINSVLAPTTDTTGGKTIMISTPSKTPDHDFIRFYLRPAEELGKLIRFTIYDNPLMTPEKIAQILDRWPDRENNTEFRREYLCEVITEDDDAVVPEFNKELQREVVREWQRPAFFDSYTAMDIGFVDLTFVIFAYYDFKNNKVIIEDELVMNGKEMTTESLAKSIKEKEAVIWKNSFTGDQKPVYLRIADNNLILINDLNRLHHLPFFPTKKDDAEMQLNNLRINMSQKKIIINPRCVNLIKHLNFAVWNKKRTSYERSPENHHYDGIDALKYLMRNISWTKNPYPANHGITGDDWFIAAGGINNEYYTQFKKMLGFNKKSEN